jgi:ABC-2 type transport system permease protein
VTTGTLVAGHILAGSVVAFVAGSLVLVAILVLTPGPAVSGPAVAAALATVLLISLAISTMWFLLFARARRASVLRGMFGIINAVLFFPSGALYTVESYPGWLRAISSVDPLTYGVDALRPICFCAARRPRPRSAMGLPGDFTFVGGVLTQVLFRREVWDFPCELRSSVLS